MQFLMIDGKGQPGEGGPKHNSEFQQAFSALYGITYAIKMSEKKGEQPPGFENFKVPPPEGLWWMKDGSSFDMKHTSDWRWTLMIRLPDFVTPNVVKEFVDTMVAKKKSDVYRKVRLEALHEGLSVQVMHTGSYADEGPIIQNMHTYALEHGYRLHGKHHEIYFGDPRRSKPENLKTVLRQPLAR